ncbi:MAG: branched-chain amino acid ABC transporter permease, partial [Thermoprotei archaeon]
MVDVVSFVFDLLTITGIFGILAISLNMEYGFTGLANFGKVAFFAIGAYTAGILSRFQGVPFPLDVVCGILLAGLAGFLVSIPALRLREDYLAITTIAFGEIVRLIILNEDWLTRGPMGIPGIPAPLRDVLAGREWLAFYTGLCFVVLAVVYWMCERVVNSPYGRVIKAIREDEVAAQALGKYTFKYKAQMFTLGSAIAGLAGG